MKVKIIEASQDIKVGFNWGKFLVGQFDSEWQAQSVIGHSAVLRECGWGPDHRLVMDLQTGEGAIFRPGPGRSPYHDLQKHQIWVCVLFEDFLTWLYDQDLSDIEQLPSELNLPQAATGLVGYRRVGMCQVHELSFRNGPNGPFCEGCYQAGVSVIGTEVAQ